MLYDRILIKYGELSLKGRNKHTFLDTVLRTIKHKCINFQNLEYERFYDRLFIILNNEDPFEVIDRLQTVFGLHSFSLCTKCESNIESIKTLALDVVSTEIKNPTTFKVETNRAWKEIPKTSIEISQEIARHVLKNSPQLTVDVHKPEVTLKIDIRAEGTYIMTRDILGLGGLPVGTDGKGLLMMSGGIDSPVAGFLIQKRGVGLEVMHFASPPYTSDRSIQKVVDLTEKLTKYAPNSKIKLHIVPFTKLQKAIFDYCPKSYGITIMRRMMYRICEQYANSNNFPLIVNGENLGQVASQTMYSMYAINSVTSMPIIRPLVTMDKNEIIRIAEKIETYEISIRPFEDCCTIFVPENPVTKPDVHKCLEFEKNFDYEVLIKECLDNIETMEIVEGKAFNVVTEDSSCPINDLF
ncbi:MAG: thiamine biosynthesis protein ThiI [Haloplasmataceae bacterium]|nr:thiamine biosynthesis protein ThiI [Haloplasmataceae bacterium]